MTKLLSSPFFLCGGGLGWEIKIAINYTSTNNLLFFCTSDTNIRSGLGENVRKKGQKFNLVQVRAILICSRSNQVSFYITNNKKAMLHVF